MTAVAEMGRARGKMNKGLRLRQPCGIKKVLLGYIGSPLTDEPKGNG